MRGYLGTAIVALGALLSFPAQEAVVVNPALTPAGPVLTLEPHAKPRVLERLAQINRQELHCLALNIYYEARGEKAEGQLAVAYVTLNRLHDSRFPKTLCKVVYQPGAFSWTADRKKRAAKIAEENAWDLAVVVAKMAMLGMAGDPTNGAVDYHATSVHPAWLADDLLVKQMGNHKFYARPEPGVTAAAERGGSAAMHAPLSLVSARGGSAKPAPAVTNRKRSDDDPELAMVPLASRAGM